MIDRQALEEVGLTDDTPVNLQVNEIPLPSALQLMLADLDLVYTIRDGFLMITTTEAEADALPTRIHWLEGTGWPQNDLASLVKTIQTGADPETWEALGGPSTMTLIQAGITDRAGLLIMAPYQTHQRIEGILDALRDSVTGNDPQLSRER